MRAELSATKNKVNLNLKTEKLPWFGFTTSSSSYNTSTVVKVSEGGALSLPHGWPLEKVWDLSLSYNNSYYNTNCEYMQLNNFTEANTN